MADKTDTPSTTKQNGDDSPKAERETERGNSTTKERVDPGRARGGATTGKQAAKAKGAATGRARSTREAADKEAARVRQAAAAEAESIKATARTDADKVKKGAQDTAQRTAEAQARRITEAARLEAAQQKKAAADEAGRVRKDAQAQARQIRQVARAQAQEARSMAPAAGQDRPETETSVPNAAQEMPGRGVPSLGELTRKAWERNMELATSMVPMYLRIYDSAVKTFRVAYRQFDQTSGRFSSGSGSGDDQVRQPVPHLADAEAEGAARPTAVGERQRVAG